MLSREFVGIAGITGRLILSPGLKVRKPLVQAGAGLYDGGGLIIEASNLCYR